MSDWLDYTVEHEFSTGRTATLRKHLPTLYLIEQGVMSQEIAPLLHRVVNGKLSNWSEATALMRVFAEGLFVNPRIADVDAPTEREDGVVEIPFTALRDEEVVETFELVVEALKASERFRAERGRAGGRGDGEGVGDDAVGDRRAAGGKPRSARARRPARTDAADVAGAAGAGEVDAGDDGAAGDGAASG